MQIQGNRDYSEGLRVESAAPGPLSGQRQADEKLAKCRASLTQLRHDFSKLTAIKTTLADDHKAFEILGNQHLIDRVRKDVNDKIAVTSLKIKRLERELIPSPRYLQAEEGSKPEASLHEQAINLRDEFRELIKNPTPENRRRILEIKSQARMLKERMAHASPQLLHDAEESPRPPPLLPLEPEKSEELRSAQPAPLPATSSRFSRYANRFKRLRLVISRSLHKSTSQNSSRATLASSTQMVKGKERREGSRPLEDRESPKVLETRDRFIERKKEFEKKLNTNRLKPHEIKQFGEFLFVKTDDDHSKDLDNLRKTFLNNPRVQAMVGTDETFRNSIIAFFVRTVPTKYEAGIKEQLTKAGTRQSIWKSHSDTLNRLWNLSGLEPGYEIELASDMQGKRVLAAAFLALEETDSKESLFQMGKTVENEVTEALQNFGNNLEKLKDFNETAVASAYLTTVGKPLQKLSAAEQSALKLVRKMFDRHCDNNLILTYHYDTNLGKLMPHHEAWNAAVQEKLEAAGFPDYLSDRDEINRLLDEAGTKNSMEQLNPIMLKIQAFLDKYPPDRGERLSSIKSELGTPLPRITRTAHPRYKGMIFEDDILTAEKDVWREPRAEELRQAEEWQRWQH